MGFSNFTLAPNGMVGLVRQKRSIPDDQDNWSPEQPLDGEGPPEGEHPRQPPGEQSSEVGEEMDFLRIFMSLNEEERILIGHNFTSFIKACTFRGKDCLKETYVCLKINTDD
jgi:hypothetical protein